MKYRKKPVVIDAHCMDNHNYFNSATWPDWLHRAWEKENQEVGALFRRGEHLRIYTLEGEHTVSLGNWIIQGVKGELYPCKPDIFNATYEAA